jgi:hypothetical protein
VCSLYIGIHSHPWLSYPALMCQLLTFTRVAWLAVPVIWKNSGGSNHLPIQNFSQPSFTRANLALPSDQAVREGLPVTLELVRGVKGNHEVG